VSGGPDNRADDQADASRERRLEDLAASLGLELPVFEGPLTAFAVGGEPRPILLGGDLHAVHPESADPLPPDERDRSLDAATVILDDQEHPPLKIAAVEGIWCLALPDHLLDPAPYFALWDTEGRLRAWLLLPPPRTMIGIGHFWLPEVKPPPDPPGIVHPGSEGSPPSS
jgi:hypothetical protein